VRGYPQNQLGPQVASVQLEDLLFPSEEGGEPVCLPEEVVDLTCDASALHDDAFFERPTGGTRILEGSLELRFPLTRTLLSGAAFVDFGQVWEEGGRFTFDRLVFSPGIGVRYATPVGPVRVDVAYRGRETFRRPIVTSQLRPFDPDRDDPDDRLAGPGGETLDWVRVEDLAPLGPLVSFEEGGGSLWSRLQLHVSIGHAF
jgi:hypothetical protein